MSKKKSITKKRSEKKRAAVILLTLAALIAAGITAFSVSPWPAALLIRVSFDRGSDKTAAALAKHVPAGVSSVLNLRYDPEGTDTFLDVYYPSEAEGTRRTYPTIVWVHGGGWLSGNKGQISNYAQILAAAGYTVAAAGYSIAPEAVYPTPLIQINKALAFLAEAGPDLHADPDFLILAGDSAGAHIAAQVACVITSPAYAEELGIVPLIKPSALAGTILYCGTYDTSMVDFSGPMSGFLRTLLWAYMGNKDFLSDPRFAAASVIGYVTPDFPPSFISAGNGDPLAPHSYAFAEKLTGLGVTAETLFFAADFTPPAGHEYQFNLDTGAGQRALEKSLDFLDRLGNENSE
ncbi:alpha/beta hydrolase [Breznakiella homolactica]|uniref:Alpha/beta hydrolase n=1 Tax=Breznakiella homolactica TaxID=2798577 RepID=A0A7T8BBL0_9SPIR|nr:alpha/beta hydrolase [Breznakiella homolactica]QQO10175.1 alpha/beta hydrolase [Breznakiella homolactica]